MKEKDSFDVELLGIILDFKIPVFIKDMTYRVPCGLRLCNTFKISFKFMADWHREKSII